MTLTNRAVVVTRAARDAADVPAALSIEQRNLPALKDGDVLIRARYCSLDPTMHTWVQMTDYVMSPRPGDVLLSQQVGEIVESRLAGYNVGDMVTTFGGLQEYSVVRSTPRRRPRWR